MKKHLLFAPLLLVALALFGLHGTPFSLPLSVMAAGSADSPQAGDGNPQTDGPAKSADQPLEAGPQGLDDKVSEWIAALASQPAYATWKQATRAVYPLGPGTHSWLVSLTVSGREVGYLIVATEKQGGAYSLVEYGTGGNPLYSLNTLYQGLIRHEIIDPHLSYEGFVKNDSISLSRVYLGPLRSFWKVTIRTDSLYFDAKTGELMPNLDEPLAAAAKADSAFAMPKGLNALSKTIATDSFDPFEKASWLKPETPSITLKRDIALMLEHRERLTFSARLFGGKLTYAFAVTGYDAWNGDTTFIRFDQDGDRAVPLDSLLQAGRITY